MSLYTGKPAPELLDYLLKRRSARVVELSEPGPTSEEIQTMLKVASRVPDHGMMVPWYFIVFEGDARSEAGDIIADVFSQKNPDAKTEEIEAERNRFMRAPTVVAVISRMRKGKKPIWEQIMSAGAACMNFSLAAHASGYGVSWLTEWYGYDEDVKTRMGMDERDHVAGFLYIGTPIAVPAERKRPDLDLIVNHFQKGRLLKKGDEYDQDKFGFPDFGYKQL